MLTAPGMEAVKKSFKGEVLENNSVEFIEVPLPTVFPFIF